MAKLSRRSMLLTPLAFAAAPSLFATDLKSSHNTAHSKMTLALHQNTSSGSGFRKSLEGWARAGIKQVELTNTLIDEYLKTSTLADARQLLADLDLTAVHAAAGTTGLLEPNPNRAAALEKLKARCEIYATLGLHATYITTGTMYKPALDDYKTAAANLHQAGDIAHQFNLLLRVEALRSSTFIATLPTLLQLTRAAAHPTVQPMFDCYHFWSGLNKLEDLDLIRPSEIGHVHFQDVPDMPRELLDSTTRIIPGDGVSPLQHILRKLAEKGYAGPLSVELFLPRFKDGDPFEVAREIRQKSEAVMHTAGVA